MKIVSLVLLVIGFFATSAHAIDKAYLEKVQHNIESTNKNNLPISIDFMTTMERMKILKLNDEYYVVAMMRVDTSLNTMGGNTLDLLRKASVKSGCSDPVTMNYMEHGLKIGVIYKNNDGDNIGEIQYSIEDCKSNN